MKVKALIPLLALLLLASLCRDANACSCIEHSPCEAFGRASAVFIGRMLGGTESVRAFTKDGQSFSVEAGQVRFSVEDSFKGVSASEIIVYVSSMKGTSCGDYGLTRGERYVVYAITPESGGLFDGPCSRTRTVEHAKEDIEFLHNLPKQGTGGRLSGHVGIDFGGRDNPPLPRVTITVRNERQSYEAVTDANGDYELTGIKPGQYQIVLNLPKGYVCDTATREVLISDRGCAKQTFWTKVDSTVGGRVIDVMGRVAPATLTLVSMRDQQRRFRGFADEDGEFSIEGIEPGRYLLYVEIVSAGKKDVFYYPGVDERDRAEILEVGMGQNLTGYTFTLPDKLIVRVIEGILQFPDGTPAARARVIVLLENKTTPGVYRTSDWPSSCDADAQGRFSVVGFSGNTYKVYAQEDRLSAISQKHAPRFSKPLAIRLDKDVKEIRVVLDSTDDPSRAQGQTPRVNQRTNP